MLLAPDAQAHRLNAAMTTVLLNERSGRLEVMHRFWLHDAEQVAGRIAGHGADLLASVEDQQRFAVYVHERFSLADGEDRPLPITLRGAEVDGDFLWVYQAMPLPNPLPGRLLIRHDALRDIWPEQVNTVNVEHRGRTRTVVFQGTAGTLEVRLPTRPPPP